MRQNQSLRVLESESEVEQTDEMTADDITTDDRGEIALEVDLPSRYEQAAEVDVSKIEENYTFPRFIDATLDELGKDFTNEEARLVDEIDEFRENGNASAHSIEVRIPDSRLEKMSSHASGLVSKLLRIKAQVEAAST